MKLKDNKLGPIFKVINISLSDDNLIIVVEHDVKKEMPNDDINEDVSKAFIFIVNQFIKNNDIDFKPNGDFDSAKIHTFVPMEPGLWGFKIYGSKIDPIEYFINNLNN